MAAFRMQVETMEDVAKIIATSVGPSGPNVDYLFHLTESLRASLKLEHDPYLIELDTLVRRELILLKTQSVSHGP
jgi:cation transport protein ChaC